MHFANDDTPSGLYAFLGGCVVLVMVGVLFTLMMDRGFLFSNSRRELQRDIETGETDIEQLKAAYQENEGESNRLRQVEASYQALLGQLQNLYQRRTTLEASCKDLPTSIKTLRTKFNDHRARIWVAAGGESLGTLKLRDGRVYSNTVIVEVTEVGLNVRHQEGRARIKAPDLDPALRERFQWDDKERLAQLKKEQDLLLQQETPPRDPEAKRENDTETETPAPSPGALTQPDAGKLETQRRNVTAWKAKVTQLSADTDDARAKADFGRQGSVPGSLETWQDRAANLKNDLAKAKQNLAAAKARLKALDPDDPMLNAPDDRP